MIVLGYYFEMCDKGWMAKQKQNATNYINGIGLFGRTVDVFA